MFSAAAQYAQAVSAQYGFQPSGASPVDDPRDSAALQAGMMASGAIQGASYATGGLSLAAMFNMAPRALDPFTGTAHAAMRGYGAAGVAGGIGMGAAVGGAYLAAGSVLKWGVDQAVFGAQQQAMLSHQLGGMAPGMNQGQVGQMAGMVSQAARTGLGSVNELTSLIQQGGQDGSLNMQSLNQFQSSFQRLLGNVRSVALALNSSLTEAQQAMQQVRSLGVAPGGAAAFLGAARGLGQAGGLGPAEMMGMAQQGAQMGRMLGIGGEAGAMGQMVQAGALGMVRRGGLIDNIHAESGGQFQGAAFRFLGSRYGTTPLAAMMREGEYDPDVAARIAGGQLDRAQMQEMARRNLAGPGARDRFNARRGELMGRFVSEFGGQAISPALEEMTSSSGSPETLRGQITGLTRADQGAMQQLNRAMPGLRARLATEGAAAFQRGAGSVGLFDAIGQNVEQIVAPYRTALQQYGADLAQSAQSVIEDVTRQFVAKPPGRADPATYARYFRAHVAGGFNPVSQAVQAGGLSSPNYFGGAQANTLLPSGLQIATQGQGVGLGELPMYGAAPIGHNRWAGAAALGAIPWTGGRNLLGMAGAGVDAFGAGTMAAFASEGSGFMGMGGVGAASGTGRLAGLTARGAGMGMMAVGRVAGAFALPALAADLAFNELPEIQRQFGQRPITQGAILGQGAQALQFASDTGLLSSPMQPRQIGTMAGGMDYEDMQRQGLVPVGGMFGEGQQLTVTQEQLASANRLMEGSGAAMSAFGRYGKVGSIAMARSGLGSTDPRTQALTLSRELGIPAKEAARYISALQMQGLQASWANISPEKYRERWVQRQREGLGGAGEPRLAADLMIQGRDPRKAGLLGGKTLDVLQDEWEQAGLSPQSSEYQVKLATALQQLDGARSGANYSRMAGNIVAGNVQPPGGGGWGDPQSQQYRSDWSKMRASVNPSLAAEQQSARQGMWGAATIGGVNASRADQYITEYTRGLTEGGEDQRVRSAESLMDYTLKDPRSTAAGLGMMSARLASGDTEAERRASLYLGGAARLKHDVQRGRSATQIIQNLMGANYGSAAAQMQEHFKRGSHWTAGIEANLLDSTRRLYQLSSGDKPINVNEAESLAREINQAGVEYAKNQDKHAFDTVARKIATLEAQAPSGAGAQPGDFTKQMTEVVAGMKDFAGALNRITANPLIKAMIPAAD